MKQWMNLLKKLPLWQRLSLHKVSSHSCTPLWVVSLLSPLLKIKHSNPAANSGEKTINIAYVLCTKTPYSLTFSFGKTTFPKRSSRRINLGHTAVTQPLGLLLLAPLYFSAFPSLTNYISQKPGLALSYSRTWANTGVVLALIHFDAFTS